MILLLQNLDELMEEMVTCAANLDGPLCIGQRRLQPVGLVPVLPCLLLGLLDLATQLGQ